MRLHCAARTRMTRQVAIATRAGRFPGTTSSVWDQSMLSYFKQAIALRKNHSVLRGGKYRGTVRPRPLLRLRPHECLRVADDRAERGRRTGQRRVAARRGRTEQAQTVRCLFGDPTNFDLRTGQLAVSLPPRSGAVFGSAVASLTPRVARFAVGMSSMPSHTCSRVTISPGRRRMLSARLGAVVCMAGGRHPFQSVHTS